ncbi:MAG: iron complex transport system substrate-binding protein [Alphaproteobacteria bacterium]|nr:iron complex transport system substrate-binding protein [Alphaproteobacteria bacterium]
MALEPDARRLMDRFLAAGIAALMLTAAHGQPVNAPHKPMRIVSLNMCVDELVVRLADRKNIASVTWLSLSPGNSNVADLVAGLPVNHGLAEQIIPLNPDLVIAGAYTTRTAVALLKRTGIPVMEVDVPHSIDEMRAQYRDIGDVLGERERAERILADIDARLVMLPAARPAVRPRAIVLNPNGVTVGPGTLADELITRAGFENVAATLGIDNYGQVPLETVVANAVDVLLLSAARDGPPAMATEILKHPVLTALSGRTRLVVMPNRLWNCGGPAVVDAIELLMRAAGDVRAAAQRP